MIFPATEAIQETFQAHALKCAAEEHENESLVLIGMTSETTSFRVLFISRSEQNDVAMRIYNLLRFTADKQDEMLEAVNTCNTNYRYLRFVVDPDENTVDAEYDFPSNQENIGDAAFEMLMRSAHIIDKCYPNLMHSLYG